LCDQPLIAVGFCHLVCPIGHYQEVCSDLFPADRIEADPRASADQPGPITISKESSRHES